MSALGSLVVKLALETAEFTKGLDKSDQETLKFAKNVQSAVDRAERSFGSLAKSVVAVGAAYLSVNSIINTVNSSIDTLAKLDDASQKTGAAVEKLSQLQKVAVAFGHDFDGLVEPSITKLARGIAGLDDPTNKANAALKTLGISSKDSHGNLRDAAEITIEVAKKLQNYRDDATKSALATDLFGKSGSNLIPYLNDAADSVDKFSGVSAQAAAQASAVQDKLNGLKQRTSEYTNAIVVDALPAMNDFIGAFVDITTQADALGKDQSITTWADSTALAVAVVYDTFSNLKDELIAIGSSFKVVAGDVEVFNASAKLLNPSAYLTGSPIAELARAKLSRDQTLADANAQYEALANKNRSAFEDSIKSRISRRGSDASPYIPPSGSDKPSTGYVSGQDAKDAAAAKQISDYQKLTRSINEKIAANEAEIKTNAPLTDSEKILATVSAQRADGTIKITDAEYANVKALLQKLDAGDRDLAMTKLRLQADTDYEKSLSDATSSLAKYNDEMLNATISMEEKAASQEYENSLIGKTDAQLIQLKASRNDETIAQLESQKAYLITQGNREDELDLITRQIDALNRLKGAETDGAQLQKAADSQKSFWASVDDTAHRVWTNVGQGGVNAFKMVGQTLKSTVLDVLYQLTFKKWIISVGTSISAGSAGSAVASAGEALSSGTSLSGGLDNAFMAGKSLLNGLSNFQTSFASSIADFGGFLTGHGLENLGQAITLNSQLISNVVPFAGAAIQALTGDVKGAAFTAGGAAIGSIIPGVGTALGGIIGGVIGSLFGGSKTKGDQVNGSYSNGVYKNTASFSPEGGGSVGAASTLQSINQQFTSTLGSFLSQLGVNSSINVVSNYKAKKDVQAAFSGNVNGIGFGTGWENFGSGSDAFQKFFDKTFSTVLVQGIKASGISSAIKSLFDGLTDKTAIANMMQSTLSLNAAQTQLANSFNLTVDAAARVAKTQTDVTGAISALVSAAGSMQTIGDQVVATRSALQSATGFQVLPASLKEFDNLLKQIDTSTAAGIDKFASLFSSRTTFASLTNTTDALKTNVTSAIYNVAGTDRKNAIANSALTDMFGTFNLQVPTSIEELIKLGDSIDYASKSGIDLANVFPSLVDAFTKAKGGVDGLTSSLNGYSETNFATVIDLQRYRAARNAYGSTAANANVSASGGQNITNAELLVFMKQLAASMNSTDTNTRLTSQYLLEVISGNQSLQVTAA